MSAKEPDHIPPSGVALSGNNDVGADRGSAGVGGEQEVPWRSAGQGGRTGATRKVDGTWVKMSLFTKDVCDTTPTNLICSA